MEKLSLDLVPSLIHSSSVNEMYSIESIEFVHLILYSFTGGAHYNQEDKVWIYDKDTNKKVDKIIITIIISIANNNQYPIGLNFFKFILPPTILLVSHI